VPIDVLGYHHFTLLTRDIDASSAFYEGTLGLRRKVRPDFGHRGLWYDMGGGQELHLIETPDVPAEHEGHPAFEVRDVRAAVDACRAAGARVQQDVFVRTHDGSLSAFVRDPDENLIEFTQHQGV
jgi:catechol 2,3-dioxygenase-like lactoylglutathione lyase family enzyme